MVMDFNTEENENQEEEPVIVENSSLDLESYCNNYTGLARIHRLIFIADRCTNLRVEALKMALNYVQLTYNVNMYTKLHRKLVEAMGEEGSAGNVVLPDIAGGQAVGASNLPQLDTKWIEIKSKSAALKLEKLDGDLKSSKLNSIKESIRRGHDDLGDHYLDCGDLSNALKCYSRARDYCTSFKHVINMCFNVIKVSVYLNNWTHVHTYVSKAEATPDFERANRHSESVLESDGAGALAPTVKNNKMMGIYTRLSCAEGLAHLATKKYKMAAKSFITAQLDACDFPDLISPSNVALYGGLCALATFSRQELYKHVINSNSFKLFLEVEPQLRDVIFKFYQSRYAMCLSQLDDLMNVLWLDIYLAPHMKTLYANIRNRALIQYFSPYMSADLEKMALAFNTTVFALEDELMKLILEGQIQGRIDSHNKVIYAKSVEARRVTFEKALEMGKEHEMKMKALILRAALIKNHIHVKQHSRDSANQNTSEEFSIGVPEGGYRNSHPN